MALFFTIIIITSVLGIVFVLRKIAQEINEAAQDSGCKAYHKHYRKNGECSECGCYPCNCCDSVN